MTLLVGYLLGSTATLLLLLLLNAKRELPEGASVGLLLLSGFGGGSWGPWSPASCSSSLQFGDGCSPPLGKG